MQNSLSTSNFKIYMKRLFATLVLVFAIVFSIGKIFTTLQGPKNSVDAFYKIPENTIDVLNVGSSHVYCSINPVEMWDQAGITSYNFARGSQSQWYSYYFIEEALKTQAPKVILLDVYTVLTADERFVEKAQMNLLSLKPSYTKYEAVMSSENKNAMEIFWGFPIWHNRYNSMGSDDYYAVNEKLMEKTVLGYIYPTNIEVYENVEDVSNVTECIPISEKTEKYLRKSIELCQERGIEIVLINAPWPLITEETQKKYNYVAQIAEEYEIGFLNGCLLEEEIGISWQTDSMGDGGHLNHYGSLKFTNYLVEYLKENYELKDHRGDEVYSYWNYESGRFHAYEGRGKYYSASNVIEYMDVAMNDDDCVVVISVENCEDQIGTELLNKMQKYGISWNDGSLVIKNGKDIVVNENGRNEYTHFIDIGNKDVISVIREDNADALSQNIYISGSKVDKVEGGINIVVYDRSLNMLVDTVGFDASNEWQSVR